MQTTDCSSYCSMAENCTSTEMNIDKVTHVWTINNFNFCEAKGEIIHSPVFSASTNDKVKWFLKLNPNGESKDTIDIGLNLSNISEHKIVFSQFSISIFNTEHESEVKKTTKCVQKFVADDATKNNIGWTICKKDEYFRNKILSNDVLKIYWEVTFSQEGDVVLKHHQYSSTQFLQTTVANDDGAKILDVLLRTHLLADVVISVQNKEYPAHKAVLAARSAVFAAMFQHNTRENLLSRVDIEDLGEEIIGEMLRFIYTGRCEKLDELAGDLLAAGDKYDLDQLKMISSKALCENLSIENVAQTLILADMHNANELKIEVMKFIVTKSAEVFDSKGWERILSYPRLLNEVCRAVARR